MRPQARSGSRSRPATSRRRHSRERSSGSSARPREPTAGATASSGPSSSSSWGIAVRRYPTRAPRYQPVGCLRAADLRPMRLCSRRRVGREPPRGGTRQQRPAIAPAVCRQAATLSAAYAQPTYARCACIAGDGVGREPPRGGTRQQRPAIAPRVCRQAGTPSAACVQPTYARCTCAAGDGVGREPPRGGTRRERSGRPRRLPSRSRPTV